MSADDPYTPPPDPTADAPRIPALKRRYRKPDEPEPEPLPEVDEAALLSVVLQSVQRRKGGEQAPARRGINRFLPRSADPVAPAASSEEGRAPEASAPAPLPKRAVAPIARPRVRGRSTWQIRYDLVFYAALAAAVLSAAFLAGRYSVPPPVVVVAKAPEATQTATSLPNFSEQMAKALAAEHAGDLETALQITKDLTRGVEPGPALLAYQATLATRLGLSNDVEADLARRLRTDFSPSVVGPLNAARAFNYARRRQFDDALPCFAAVDAVDPFDVANLLHWGETLRRKGSFGEAEGKFREALARMPIATSPYLVAQHEYIAYERRLCQVENGKVDDLAPELEQHLGQPAPSGYWRLTAAAVALEKGDMPAAVDALTKAQTMFTPVQFGALLSDYFFHAFAYHPELNAFLTATTPEQKKARLLGMDYYVDP